MWCSINLKAHLAAGATLFGSTLLHDGVPLSSVGRRLMKLYNRKGIFTNRHDTLAELERELAARFRDVTIATVGCGALFSARV